MKKLSLTIMTILLVVLSILFIACKQEATSPSDDAVCEEHDYGDWTVNAPTCTASGTKIRVCNDCEDEEIRTIEPIGHTEVEDKEVSPTCTQSGLTLGKHCSACGLIIVEQESIDQIGHDYDGENIVWDWSGYTAAKATLTCKNDGTHTTQVTASISEKTVTSATCTKSGKILYTATIIHDGQAYSNQKELSIPSLGHDTTKYNKKDPSCTTVGWYSYEACTRCEYSTYTEIPNLGHDTRTHSAQEPTCTDNGWDSYETCSRCGYSSYVEKPKLGHRYANDVCIRCGKQRISEGLVYVSNGDGTCYVSDIGTCKDKNIIIPAISPSGEDVVGIGAKAFDWEDITSIIIPEGVTYIGASAFYYSDLVSITIPSTITEIRGGNVFSGCSNLMEVNISDLAAWCEIKFATHSCNPLSNMGYLYLNGELITELIIPNNTSVSAYAFYGCSGITSVVFSDSIRIVGQYAFCNCRDLRTVTIPHSITSFGGYTFKSCRSLTDIYYHGTEAEWNKFAYTASVPSSATIHYL
ncbi:MAG: leucine-rich repeat domain-containing protein [Clostridia bacterium]|nr:leucine-rich repeat domain-containing protein [Clostridia bacterium]